MCAFMILCWDGQIRVWRSVTIFEGCKLKAVCLAWIFIRQLMVGGLEG